MPIGVVRDKCVMVGNKATVVVEGDNPEEVMTKEARELVLRHAAQMGVQRPGLGTGGGPYPVDQDGNSGDPVATANAGGCRYRYDWPVQGGL
jgi:hypothetical protein